MLETGPPVHGHCILDWLLPLLIEWGDAIRPHDALNGTDSLPGEPKEGCTEEEAFSFGTEDHRHCRGYSGHSRDTGPEGTGTITEGHMAHT